MTYPCTIYTRPNGHKTEIEIVDIEDDDAAWFKEHNIIIGMEEIYPGQYVIYAEYGEEAGEPLELTYIVPSGQICRTALSNIRQTLKDKFDAVSS